MNYLRIKLKEFQWIKNKEILLSFLHVKNVKLNSLSRLLRILIIKGLLL